MAAAEMAGRPLERYALTMDEIEVPEQRCVQVEVRIGGQRRRPVDCCVTAVAWFCDCKVWFSRDEAGVSYVFFGFEADRSLVRTGSPAWLSARADRGAAPIVGSRGHRGGSGGWTSLIDERPECSDALEGPSTFPPRQPLPARI
jgi:hypothetical protein